MAPLVSVVMPVATRTPWLQIAVDSILSQSLTDLELLIIGYPDIESWSDQISRDSRVRIMIRDGDGIVSALNTGLKHARGRYIARMDADDVSLVNRLETQLQFLDSQPLDIVGARVSLLSEPDQLSSGNQRYVDWLNSLTTTEQLQRNLFVECVLPHPTFFATKSVFEALGHYREVDWPEDHDLLLRAHLSGMTIGKPDQCLLQWRDHAKRLSRTDARYRKEQFVRLKVWALQQSGYAEKTVILCGTGNNARLWHDILKENNIQTSCFVEHDDITNRTSKRHLPVISYQHLLDEWDRLRKDHLIISVVSAFGAREAIRERFDTAGLSEGYDYVIAG